MFTGLVQDVGVVEVVDAGEEGMWMRVTTSLAPEIDRGDSIAVDGCCLTAISVVDDTFAIEAMNQTLSGTTLDYVGAGDRVNLELAMRASDRLGGHIVQGHVDGVGEVLAVEVDGFARRLRVALPEELLRYAIDKGSIALAGVSLTIAALGEGWIEVSVIPETLERTALGDLGAGDRLNVECDVVARYVERLMSP